MSKIKELADRYRLVVQVALVTAFSLIFRHHQLVKLTFVNRIC